MKFKFAILLSGKRFSGDLYPFPFSVENKVVAKPTGSPIIYGNKLRICTSILSDIVTHCDGSK